MSIKPVEFIMSQHLPAQECWKGMKDKFQKLFSILRGTRSYQQALIRLADFGTLKLQNVSKLCKAMRIKSFRVCLIMKGTQLLQVRKITHAKYGGIVKSTRKNESLCVNYCFLIVMVI